MPPTKFLPLTGEPTIHLTVGRSAPVPRPYEDGIRGVIRRGFGVRVLTLLTQFRVIIIIICHAHYFRLDADRCLRPYACMHATLCMRFPMHGGHSFRGRGGGAGATTSGSNCIKLHQIASNCFKLLRCSSPRWHSPTLLPWPCRSVRSVLILRSSLLHADQW